MNRRSLFGFLAAAPFGVFAAVKAAQPCEAAKTVVLPPTITHYPMAHPIEIVKVEHHWFMSATQVREMFEKINEHVRDGGRIEVA